jgi:hypothetical protein
LFAAKITILKEQAMKMQHKRGVFASFKRKNEPSLQRDSSFSSFFCFRSKAKACFSYFQSIAPERKLLFSIFQLSLRRETLFASFSPLRSGAKPYGKTLVSLQSSIVASAMADCQLNAVPLQPIQ